MGQVTLVLGGVRSGKSHFAEELAARHPPVTYLATALAGDAEMAGRIDRHRERRSTRVPPWRTVEEPWNVAEIVRAHQDSGCLLVECLGFWLTNLLVGLPDRRGLGDEELAGRVEELAAALGVGAGRAVVVSSEVGCGLLPANALARRFGDLLGEANQRLAAAAEEVYACIAGIPLRLK